MKQDFVAKHGKLWIYRTDSGTEYLPTDADVRRLKKKDRLESARVTEMDQVQPSSARGARDHNCHFAACVHAQRVEDETIEASMSANVSYSSSVPQSTLNRIVQPYMEVAAPATGKAPASSVRAGGLQAKLQAAILAKSPGHEQCCLWLYIQSDEERVWLSRHTLAVHKYNRKFLEDNFVHGFYSDRGRGAPKFANVHELRKWILDQDQLSLQRGWNPAFWTRHKFMKMSNLQVSPSQDTDNHEQRPNVCCTLPSHSTRHQGTHQSASPGLPQCSQPPVDPASQRSPVSVMGHVPRTELQQMYHELSQIPTELESERQRLLVRMRLVSDTRREQLRGGGMFPSTSSVDD